MSGKKEKGWEKVSRFVRINPVTLGLAIVFGRIGFSLVDSQNLIGQIGSYLSFGAGAWWGRHYIIDIKSYYRDCKLLEKYGYSLEHAKKRMKPYCERQRFYVACIKNGFRDEVTELIKETPSNEKKYSFMPHF